MIQVALKLPLFLKHRLVHLVRLVQMHLFDHVAQWHLCHL